MTSTMNVRCLPHANILSGFAYLFGFGISSAQLTMRHSALPKHAWKVCHERGLCWTEKPNFRASLTLDNLKALADTRGSPKLLDGHLGQKRTSKDRMPSTSMSELGLAFALSPLK